MMSETTVFPEKDGTDITHYVSCDMFDLYKDVVVAHLRHLLRNQFPKDRFNESMFKTVEEFINWVEENSGGHK